MQSKEMKKVVNVFKLVNNEGLILDNNIIMAVNDDVKHLSTYGRTSKDLLKLSYKLPENTNFVNTVLPIQKLSRVLSTTLDTFHFAFDTQDRVQLGNVFLKTMGQAKTTIQPLSTNNPTHSHAYNSDNYFNALQYAILAMSKDETRKHLHGFLCEDNKIITTDGHRMHMCTLTGDSEKSYHVNDSVSKILLAILKINKKSTFKLEFIDDDYLIFHIGRFILECKNQINDITFPPYDKVIPTDNNICIPVNVKEFTKNIKQAIAIADNEKVIINVEDNTFCLSGDDGSFNINCFTVPFDGKLKMGFNIKYLLDALKVNCDSVSLNFAENDNLTPITVKSDNAVCVVMPMRM